MPRRKKLHHNHYGYYWPQTLDVCTLVRNGVWLPNVEGMDLATVKRECERQPIYEMCEKRLTNAAEMGWFTRDTPKAIRWHLTGRFEENVYRFYLIEWERRSNGHKPGLIFVRERDLLKHDPMLYFDYAKHFIVHLPRYRSIGF